MVIVLQGTWTWPRFCRICLKLMHCFFVLTVRVDKNGDFSSFPLLAGCERQKHWFQKPENFDRTLPKFRGISFEQKKSKFYFIGYSS